MSVRCSQSCADASLARILNLEVKLHTLNDILKEEIGKNGVIR
jgi:hypothetical protein